MSSQDLVGQKLGPYILEGILGQGTVATVYRARNAQDELFALKLLAPKYGLPSDEITVRFEREARAMARLNHPNIVRVYDSGRIDGHSFMAMAYVEGETFDKVLRRKSRLRPLQVTDIGRQIASALDYAHRHRVIHRDVKPSNILITQEDQTFLTDFGVARLLDDPTITRVGAIVGTAAYMAPEQVLPDTPVDGRADLYSLGVILYRAATGMLPFIGTGPEIMHAQAYEEPLEPSRVARISPVLEAIILKAMAKNPADRYQDGNAMAQALSELNEQIRERQSQQNFLQLWWDRVRI
jgi:serine/threonine protein kinase